MVAIRAQLQDMVVHAERWVDVAARAQSESVARVGEAPRSSASFEATARDSTPSDFHRGTDSALVVIKPGPRLRFRRWQSK